MADEPIGMGDPSGGSVGSAVLEAVGGKVAFVAATTFIGGIVGLIVGNIEGKGDAEAGAKGFAIGASVGLLAGLSLTLEGGGFIATTATAHTGSVLANKAAEDAMQKRIETTVQNNSEKQRSKGGPNAESFLDNDEPDDNINVDTKSNRVYIIKTKDNFDMVSVDGGTSVMKEKGATEIEYSEKGYSIWHPYSVGMGAVDGAIVTLTGLKSIRYAYAGLKIFFSKQPLKSADYGQMIGWGTRQEAKDVQQTINVTKNLTRSQVKKWAQQGLPKSWVKDQLSKYNRSLMKEGDKLKNKQLIPRKELMEKILKLW